MRDLGRRILLIFIGVALSSFIGAVIGKVLFESIWYWSKNY